MPHTLKETVEALLHPEKGVLAADESVVTAGKRLATIGLKNTEENRRAYRELFLNAEGMEKYLSGVILFDETLWQTDSKHKPFTEILEEKRVMIGVKVDEGLMADSHSQKEELTKGLATLPNRLETYKEAGARFTKWRMVVHIGDDLPGRENITQNAEDMARYAKAAQDAGLLPIIEPEILMDGNHTLEECERVAAETLQIVFAQMRKYDVLLPFLLLKTGMVLPGSEAADQSDSSIIAAATMRVLHATVPEEVPGIVFLSGGQESIRATKNLQAIAELGPQPWQLTFSYARALQEDALLAWGGKPENMQKAREVFLHRASMNSLARQGLYSGE